MGEAKRKEAIRRVVDTVTRQLTEEGRLIEAGFAAMLILVYPDGLEDELRLRLRDAFFGGAQHLFGSMTGSLLDEDAEPTDADMRRMELINSELSAFVNDYAKRHGFEPPTVTEPGGRQ